MTAQILVEPHHIEWRINNACEPHAKFICTATVGAQCRSWCAVGCDEMCSAQPEYRWQADGTVIVVGHPWEDSGECRIVAWLENGGTPGDLYMGEDDELVRSGPIETDWDGDVYLWQYALEAGQ